MPISRFGLAGRSIVAAVVAVSLLPSNVRAQSASEDLSLDEIIVTARKREENLQDVPLSISVTTAVQIEQRGIKTVQDLIQTDSSLNFDDGFAPGDVRITIRGLSPTRGRPNVATLIDGIDISSENVGTAGGSLLATPRLIDASQVEVVKGPQSALFGRSAFAGAINYVTKDPSKEFEFGVNLDGNDEEDYSGQVNVSMPLGETLGVRFNGLWWDEKGYYKNTITGGDVGGGEGLGGAVTLKWEPNESLDFKLRAEYTDDKFDSPAQAIIPFNGFNAAPASASRCNGGFINDISCAGPAQTLHTLSGGRAGLDGTPLFDDMQVPAFIGTVPDADKLRVLLTPDYRRSTDGGITGPDYPGSDRDVRRVSLVANWNVGSGKFTSLTGYTDANLFTDFDSDKSAIPGTQLGNDLSTVENRLTTWGSTKQFSQELRFTSDFDGPLNFVTGLQYWTEELEQFDANNNVIANGTLCSFTRFTAAAMYTGSCTPAGNGIRVGPYMDDTAAVRGATLTERETDHKSAYLQLTWGITDAWTVGVEGRYTDETNTVSGDDPIELRFAGAPAFPPGAVYYSDAGAGQQSGSSIVILCGATGLCTPGAIPNNPVRGFYPVGAGLQLNPALAAGGCVVYSGQTTCLPPGSAATLVNPGYIRNTYERDDGYFTPRATVQWKPGDGKMLYATYAEGEKPGGISTLFGGSGLYTRSDFEFKPEKMEEYEVGAKLRLTDSWIVNLAVFREDFSDKQVNTQIATGSIVLTRIENAASAVVDGFEIESTLRVTEHLTVSGNFTYLDGKYEDYRVRSNGTGEVARVGNCEVVVTGTSVGCIIDRSGNKMEDTPKYAFFGNATYRRPLGSNGLMWSVALDTQYQDERFLEDDNTVRLDSYWLANLRLGLEGEKWSVIAYADNLFDDDTVKSAGGGPGLTFSDWRAGSAITFAPFALQGVFAPLLPTAYFANMPDPRRIGLRVGYKF